MKSWVSSIIIVIVPLPFRRSGTQLGETLSSASPVYTIQVTLLYVLCTLRAEFISSFYYCLYLSS